MRPDSDQPYYTAYDKRYREIYRQGVTYWTSSPDELSSITESVDAFIDRNAVPDGAYILDVGCGEGGLGVYLLEKGYAYTGIDVSPTAVERATERIAEYGNQGRIMQMDALDVSAIVDEVYDAVIDIGCLPLLVVDLHRQQYLQHLWRMLKEGAPALFSRQAFDPESPDSYIDSYDAWLAFSRQEVDMPQFQNAWQDDRPYPIQLPDIATRSRTLNQYRAELETTGFDFLYDRVSRTGVHITLEVRRPDEDPDRIDFDDDYDYRRDFDEKL